MSTQKNEDTVALRKFRKQIKVELGAKDGEGIKLVELVDGVCWGCVFFLFLISTQQPYQGIKLVELVDGVCWGFVFFLISTQQSYQGIKPVELVDGVCLG
ncbi:hypothetical protein LAZ67_18000079 [Cordylochernes scorpioides]|uniref:Uncharacterized protein n=1 Tax=Cordylochernes scorpioides TaxID=51811 RepID=A0ABY6LGR4_9ARAC|nr:hypothetical protein LAZ67_18000079 [Cordylochernes scorpioides]